MGFCLWASHSLLLQQSRGSVWQVQPHRDANDPCCIFFHLKLPQMEGNSSGKDCVTARLGMTSFQPLEAAQSTRFGKTRRRHFLRIAKFPLAPKQHSFASVSKARGTNLRWAPITFGHHAKRIGLESRQPSAAYSQQQASAI